MKPRTKSRKEAAGKRAHEQTKPLCKLVQGALDSYFRDLNGHNPGDGLYRMVIEEVERPLLEKVLPFGEAGGRVTGVLMMAIGVLLLMRG